MSLTNLEFELPRRVVLLSSQTTMPDNSPLGVTGDPNTLDATRKLDSTTGEFLLDNAPPMTMYLDTVGDIVWRRTIIQTWEQLSGDESVPYNPNIEWIMASLHEDNTFHFEKLDIFLDESGVPIYFESILEDDEDLMANSSEFLLVIEGGVAIIDGTEGILMETADGPNKLLDVFTKTIDFVAFQDEVLRDLRGSMSDADTQQTTVKILNDMLGNSKYVQLIRKGVAEHSSDATNTWFYVSPTFRGATAIKNNGIRSYSTQSSYLIFDNFEVIELNVNSREYRLFISDTTRQITDITTGDTHAF